MGDLRCYELSGLRVASTLAVHADAEGAPYSGDDEVDAIIMEGEVPSALEHPNFEGPVYQAADGALLLHVDDLVRCIVSDGRKIVYERAPQASDDDLRVFVLGSAFGALCHQRGLFPLHASAIEVDGGAVAFVGRSGSGKSTLAAFLADRGHPVLCDDVCVVWTDGASPEVAPGLPTLRLWRHAIEGLGRNTSDLDAVRANVPKYHLPIATPARPDRLPLRRIYALREERGPRGSGIEQVHGMHAVNVVAVNAYRRRFPRQMALKTQLFELATVVADAADVSLIIRPMGFGRLMETHAMLEADWARSSEEAPA